MSPKQTAARARKHLKTIRLAAHKFASEYRDLDSYLEHRAEDIIDLADAIEKDVQDSLSLQEKAV